MTDWLSPDAWWHVTAPVTGGSANRSAELLNHIVDQFEVETHQRYTPRGGTTFCNVFVNDVTRALACEVAQMEHRAASIVELDANAQIDWLAGPRGIANGWTECTQRHAREAADNGLPVVVTWKNPGGIGHVAVGVPAPEDALPDGYLWIAQAGARNFRCGPVAAGFGLRPVKYFTHE